VRSTFWGRRPTGQGGSLPCRSAQHWPSAVLQSRAVPSSLPVSRRCPSGLRLSQLMPPRWSAQTLRADPLPPIPLAWLAERNYTPQDRGVLRPLGGSMGPGLPAAIAGGRDAPLLRTVAWDPSSPPSTGPRARRPRGGGAPTD
jgi:hypothetical protein